MNYNLVFRHLDKIKDSTNKTNYLLLKNYYSSETLSKKDNVICLDNETLIQEKKISEEYKGKAFIQMVNYLNIIHNLDREAKYWGILLGSWFERFTEIFFNRYLNLISLVKKYKIDKVIINEDYNHSLKFNFTSKYNIFVVT